MKKTSEHVRKELCISDRPLMSGPLLVIVHFRFPAVASLSVPKKLAIDTCPYAKRPDGDNLEKFLNDALNSILWDDDASIAWMLRSKSFTMNKAGSTTIFVREISEGKPDYSALCKDIMENISVGELLNGHC